MGRSMKAAQAPAVCLQSGGKEKRLTYPEAARWLLQLNGFDDAGLKKKIRTDKELPSFKPGWLGQLGLIIANGSNLFETLMLNFVLLDHQEEPWESAAPVWEKDTPDLRDRVLDCHAPRPGRASDAAIQKNVAAARGRIRYGLSCVKRGAVSAGKRIFGTDDAVAQNQRR